MSQVDHTYNTYTRPNPCFMYMVLLHEINCVNELTIEAYQAFWLSEVSWFGMKEWKSRQLNFLGLIFLFPLFIPGP